MSQRADVATAGWASKIMPASSHAFPGNGELSAPGTRRGEAGTRRRHSFKGRLTMGQEMEHP